MRRSPTSRFIALTAAFSCVSRGCRIRRPAVSAMSEMAAFRSMFVLYVFTRTVLVQYLCSLVYEIIVIILSSIIQYTVQVVQLNRVDYAFLILNKSPYYTEILSQWPCKIAIISILLLCICLLNTQCTVVCNY